MSELISVFEQVDYKLGEAGYEAVRGVPEGLAQVAEPEVIYEELAKRFEEGNDTYHVINGASGRTYEVAIFNADRLGHSRRLKPSTSFSSLYKNPANALETALAATVNPDSAYIYVANFGNRPTGHLSANELRYIASSGRYTTGTGTTERPYAPLNSVADMADALGNHGLAPTDITADVEAGRLALGLMSAFDKDTISGAYLNGLDGISSSASYVRAKLTEDLVSRIHRRAVEEGKPGELIPVNIKDVKQKMPNIYHGYARIAHIPPYNAVMVRDIVDKVIVTFGFRKNDNLNDLNSHAVYHDLSAAMRRQNATITLQFNRQSAIHDIADCILFGKLAMDNLPAEMRNSDRRLRLIIGDGTLDQSTETPLDRTKVEGYSLPNRRGNVATMAEWLLDSRVLCLEPLAECA